MKSRCATGCVAILIAAAAGPAWATPPILTAWQNRYPNSTIPDRMQSTTGSACNTCHNPASFAAMGNCYREDIILALQGGAGVATALANLDGVDSDLDGFANGVEIDMLRTDLPGDVGFNPGLVGDMGADPCADNPGAPVTNVAETPPDAVPTLSEWGVIVMAMLLLAGGSIVMRTHAPAGRDPGRCICAGS